MFTGIIEQIGIIKAINHDEENIDFTISSSFTNELKIDQSVSHDGCCLTVVKINNDLYTVTAIQETLHKTNLGSWEIGSKVNLERCTLMNGRLDGHIVQGHVDTIGVCTAIENKGGSLKYTFEYEGDHITVEKGSITINGISLTVVDSRDQSFSVYIIPFTRENTNLNTLKIGDKINLEFDVIGKYLSKLLPR